ncbi:MAG: SLBB domain-containing protein [Ignavibacteria bacterium]|nr:SLBB domain-containing protein [Ignavibacteria bacterium]
MKKLFLLISIIFFAASTVLPQSDSTVYGEALKRTTMNLNYFNYSNPASENIEVYVWGGIKNPGIYLVPVGTDLVKLISLTGGALDDRIYESFKLIRPKSRTGNMKTDSAYVFNYQDFFDPDKTGSYSKNNPELKAGDILVFPLSPGQKFWDIAGKISAVIVLPILSVTLVILQIINLSR